MIFTEAYTTNMKEKVVLNWSSGKDAALAFYYLQQSDSFCVSGLLTSISEKYKRVSMHGVSERILERQARHIGIPLKKIYLPEEADMVTYNKIMSEAVNDIKQKGITSMAFGDIFLEDLRKYREDQLAAAGMKALFPLWKKSTADLVREIEDSGIKAMIVCVDEAALGKEFLGKYVGRSLLQSLPETVDPCGENGEFHTLVIDAPYFNSPLSLAKGAIVYKTYNLNEQSRKGFYFLDLKED